jgi:hypothetical protein
MTEFLDLYEDNGTPMEDWTLRDQRPLDLKKPAAWFNDAEFAKYRNVNGEQILCILVKKEAAAFTGTRLVGSSKRDSHIGEGVQRDEWKLYIRTNEYGSGSPPRIGQELRVDGKKFYVLSSFDQDGVLAVTMSTGAERIV